MDFGPPFIFCHHDPSGFIIKFQLVFSTSMIYSTNEDFTNGLFLVSGFRMFGFGWESGFGWEHLDYGGGFGLCGHFLGLVGALLFAGDFL